MTKELKSKRFSQKELNELSEYEQYIKKFAPEFVDIFKGIAASANDLGISLSYHDVLRYYTNPSKYTRPDYPPELLTRLQSDLRGGCSGFAAWGKATKDGRLIASSSGDAQGSYFGSTVVVFPETGNNFITSPECALGL
ncbi:hypothetical protein ACFL7M_14720 [Thermodesulfobacteriota bacterium]